MLGKHICSKHGKDVKLLCANIYCQEAQRFICEECDDKQHKSCKEKQMLKTMEWFFKYAKETKQIAENLIAYSELQDIVEQLSKKNQQLIFGDASIVDEHASKTEHFEKFGSIKKWQQIVFDKYFQQQLYSAQEMPDRNVIQQSVNLLQQFHQQYELSRKVAIPSVTPEKQLGQKKSGKLNQTTIKKQNSKLKNIIQQQVNNSEKSQQFEIRNFQEEKLSISEAVKLEPDKSGEFEMKSGEQNFDQNSSNKSSLSSQFQQEHQEDEVQQTRVGDFSRKNEILKLDFEVTIKKAIEFFSILGDGKILVQEKQKIYFYEETGQKEKPIKCIRKTEFDSRIVWVSIQGLIAIVQTRDRQIYLLDSKNLIAQGKINNAKQHQVAFSENRLKFFKFESGTNFLEQYYLKDQQLFFEQKKEVAITNHILAIQVLSNSIYIGQSNGTVEKLDLSTFENQFTYPQTPKIAMKQFAVSDNHLFLIKTTDIILKNHKNEVIKNLEKLQPIYQMAFQYTDEGLIIVYSKKEQVEKLQFINLAHSGNVYTKEFIMKNYITSYALQPNSTCLYCVMQRKIRKYQINC